MKNHYLIISVVLFLLSSCTNTELSQKAKNKLNISENGFEFELFQRNQIEIPSDSNTVFCNIGDITGGQTHLIIKSENGILLNKFIGNGDLEYFIFNSKKYSIECLNLVNKLIGEDFGYFKISSLTKKEKVVKDESDKIEMLLKKIESSDIVFIRNGSEYSSKEAADHLRSKLNETDGKIKTLDSFIKNIASKSSMTGKPYLVKLNNGSIVKAEDWCKEQIPSKPKPHKKT